MNRLRKDQMHLDRPLAFTLIELLVVVSIIVILMAILLPALSRARETAYRSVCANNEKQQAIGMYNFMNDHNEVVARFDYGRHDGKWVGFISSISNSRPVGDPKSIVRHGAWLYGGGLHTDSYFCPSTREHCTDPSIAFTSIFQRQLNWQNSKVQKFFNTGGLEGLSIPGGPIAVTGYNCNPATAVIAQAAPWWNTRFWGEMKDLNRITKLRSYMPIVADTRNWDGHRYTYQNHNGRGFNVMSGDGAVTWVTTPGLINSGNEILAATHPADGSYNKLTGWVRWRGVARLPYPSIFNKFENSFSDNPFMGGTLYWDGVWLAMKQHLKN